MDIYARIKIAADFLGSHEAERTRSQVMVGKLLIQAKSELPHGKFGKLIESLPFGRTTAWNYMRLAREAE